MPRKTPFTRIMLVYAAVALHLGWPSVMSLGSSVPGAERSDLWNSLWSLWFFQRRVLDFASPLETTLLGFPDGGSLAVADPVNAILGLVLVPIFGLVVAYNLLVLGHLVFSGWAAHRLAEALQPDAPRAAWVAGVAYMSAPVLISAVHNGTSEAMAGGWLPLALLAGYRALRAGGPRVVLAAGLALGIALWSSWYLGLCALIGLSALMLMGQGSLGFFQRLQRLGPVLVVGLCLALPLALLQHSATTGAGNLVGIKTAAELALVRRMTGAADPLGFLIPGDFRSPDFGRLSRYGEDFIHCTYLGWVLVCGAVLGAFRRSVRGGSGWLLLAGVTGAVLAMGPVLVHDGQALLLPGDRVIPLPYLALERIPGFSGLSLLFRLAMLPSLALALLAARGFSRIGQRPGLIAMVAAALVLVEARAFAPVRGLPDVSSTELQEPLWALADAPDGAVMNFPVVGGRRYLYEQTAHGKPITGGLNFPNNSASMRVWERIVEDVGLPAEEYRAAVEEAACREGVGYLVVHVDPMARPDLHDRGVRALHHSLPVLSSARSLRVHVLCPGRAEDDAAPGSALQSG